MPRFDYQCNDCSEEFEYFIVRSDDHPHCPRCASTDLRKKVSWVAIGNPNVKAPRQTKSPKKENTGHVCTSGCNHGSKSNGHGHSHSHSESKGLYVGCGAGYADTLRKKYGYK